MLIRKAERKDMSEILELIKELAEIKKKEKLTITVYDLMRDGFLEPPRFYMYVAETEKEIVGFSLFYRAYSFQGKSIFIEDAFVTKTYKKSGIGLSLFSKVLDFSMQNKIKKIVWLLFKKYKSLEELYLRAGAKVLEDYTVAVINKENIDKIVSTNLDTKSDYFDIRFMTRRDTVEIMSLLEQSGKYKLYKHQISVYDLMKDGFGEHPWFKMLVIEIKDNIIGYLIFHDAYDTFSGKALHIEEIFVLEEYQGMGLGKMLYFEFFKHAFDLKYNKITQAINHNDLRVKSFITFFGGKFDTELQIVEITDESLNTFVHKKEK